jgi:hypothetical protein
MMKSHTDRTTLLGPALRWGRLPGTATHPLSARQKPRCINVPASSRRSPLPCVIQRTASVRQRNHTREEGAKPLRMNAANPVPLVAWRRQPALTTEPPSHQFTAPRLWQELHRLAYSPAGANACSPVLLHCPRYTCYTCYMHLRRPSRGPYTSSALATASTALPTLLPGAGCWPAAAP